MQTPLESDLPNMASSEPPREGSSDAAASNEDRLGVINDLQNHLKAIGHSMSIILPEIVVIGSQSAGKSSVLESFVGKEFLPRSDEGMASRRPIVVRMMPDRKGFYRDEADWEKIVTLPYSTIHNSIECSKDVVWMAVEQGYLDTLQHLLRSGATPIQCEDDAATWIYCKKVLRKLFFEQSADVELSEQYFHEFPFKNFHPRSSLRLFFVMRCLDLLSGIREHSYASRYFTECLNLLMKSIPEPFVAIDEIKVYLRKFSLGFNWNQQIRSICEQFQKYFPESPQFLSPRSLKHLSRCQVRDNLRAVRTLPSGVESLHLSKEIMEYLLLEE